MMHKHEVPKHYSRFWVRVVLRKKPICSMSRRKLFHAIDSYSSQLSHSENKISARLRHHSFFLPLDVAFLS